MAKRRAKKRGGEPSPRKLGAFDFGPPATLWTSDPKHRKLDVSGLASPEDGIVAVARGAMPGAYSVLERRATIVGGLAALHAAGATGFRDVHKLQVGVFNSLAQDKAILKAAHANTKKLTAKNVEARLKKAAQVVVDEVHDRKLDELAWAYRGLILLSGIKGAQLAHSAAATVLAVAFPPAGAIAGAHVAVSMAVAKKVGEEFQALAKKALKRFRKETGKGVDEGEDPPLSLLQRPSSRIWLGLAAFGGLGAAGLAVWLRNRRIAA